MTPSGPEKKFRSYVPEKTNMREFTARAIILGLIMTVILGAANLYLGLRAGMTIAATYPAAVIGMAVLRLMKGSLLEENMARTIGSIGESVAAGAVFTIPAFVLAGVWPAFDVANGYWKSAALMAVGGTLGILFVTLLRRVMVEDPDLPFPESVAASEIHKAGQQGAKAAKILFANMGIGAAIYFLRRHQCVRGEPRFHSAGGRTGPQRGQTDPDAGHAHAERGGHDHVLRSGHQPGLSRRGLYHRAAAGCVELCRRRVRVGPAGAAALVLPGAATGA